MPRIPSELVFVQPRGEEDHLARLSQVAHIKEIDGLGCGEWTVLYEYQSTADGSRCSYSGLLSLAQTAKTLQQKGWDLSIGNGAPGFTQRYDNGAEVITYDRFVIDGFEPLLYCRNFHGARRISVVPFELNSPIHLLLI
jgi:hypothetical protein